MPADATYREERKYTKSTDAEIISRVAKYTEY